ncbi:hypothetical protein UFOVP635_28 [uncultured Caudovirales phage]|uniref:Uncharacterized protein n=1 Tax=uncultured Caudovirales phage TaxID=2100421 RepID=A0A6J5N9H8_9CAUD|nr:hypothetical protein UFOVP635_28 [uncultured Caudovirales phage]
MTTNYIQAAAGVNNPVLTITVSGTTSTTATNLLIPTLQDVTINNANNVFTWSQLNESAQLQVATNATNSISSNIVVETDSFFGASGAASWSAAKKGLIGLSVDKTKVNFSINLGTKVISGEGYVTGLAPAVSADSPVWVTPITISVSGEYTIA